MKDVVLVENVLIDFLDNIFIIDKEIIKGFKCNNETIENGGVLYGFKILDKNEYVINGKTYKQEDDFATICNFERKSKFHIKRINELWHQDNSTMYFGDWHYHPVDHVHPSQTDFASFKTICKKCKSSSKYLLFIISAKKEFIIYIFDKKKRKLITTCKVDY